VIAPESWRANLQLPHPLQCNPEVYVLHRLPAPGHHFAAGCGLTPLSKSQSSLVAGQCHMGILHTVAWNLLPQSRARAACPFDSHFLLTRLSRYQKYFIADNTLVPASGHLSSGADDKCHPFLVTGMFPRDPEPGLQFFISISDGYLLLDVSSSLSLSGCAQVLEQVN
jgi:hypothetical protein